MTRLGEKIEKEEKQEIEKNNHLEIKERPEDKKEEKRKPSDKKAKDQGISAKVNKEMWEDFQRINKNRGMSTNSVINMLIADYVEEYKNRK